MQISTNINHVSFVFHRFFHHFSSRIFSTPASFRLIAFSPGHSFRLYSSRSRYLTLVQRLLHIPFAPLVTLLLPPPRTPSLHYWPPPPPPVSPLLSLAISQEASSMSRVRARPSLPPLVCVHLCALLSSLNTNLAVMVFFLCCLSLSMICTLHQVCMTFLLHVTRRRKLSAASHSFV